MEYKNPDELQSLNDLQLPQSLETFMQELPERYALGETDKNLETQMDREWMDFKDRIKNKKTNIRKKAVGISLSLAAAAGLFIGAAFASPDIAAMASNIPYLNLIFENKITDKPLMQEITDALHENHYRHSVAVSVSIKNKKVQVMIIDSKEYYDQVESSIGELIKDILKARNEEEYEVKILNDPELAQRWMDQSSSQLEGEMEKAEAIVRQVLEKYGYSEGEVGIGLSSDRIINLEHMPNTEPKMDEIKNQILENLKQESLEGYKVKVYTFDPSLEDRGRLVPLSDTIAKGLMAKKEFKVDSVGSSNTQKDYLYIEIRTTISKGDPDQQDVVNNIEKNVQEFLLSKEALQIIQDDKYKVDIKSSNGEELESLTN